MSCRDSVNQRVKASYLLYELRRVLADDESKVVHGLLDKLEMVLPKYDAEQANHDARRRKLVQLIGKHDTAEAAIAIWEQDN